MLSAAANRPGFTTKTMEGYLEYMAKDGSWADAIVIRSAAMKYQRKIHVYHSPDSLPVLYRPNIVDAQEGTLDIIELIIPPHHGLKKIFLNMSIVILGKYLLLSNYIPYQTYETCSL